MGAELGPPPVGTLGGRPSGALPWGAGLLERCPGILPVCKAGSCKGHQGVQSTPRGTPPVTLASLLRLTEEAAGSERSGNQPVVTETEHGVAGVPVPAWEPVSRLAPCCFPAGRPRGWSGWSGSRHLPHGPHRP